MFKVISEMNSPFIAELIELTRNLSNLSPFLANFANFELCNKNKLHF